MNAITYLDDELTVNFNNRMLRATSAMLLVGTFLTGMWVAPAWICLASVASIYLMTSAILDKGLAGAVATEGAAGQGSSAETNVGNAGRGVRGAAAGVALGGVLADPLVSAYVLNAVDIFTLNTVGVYLALTGIIAWDPINALFGAGTKEAESVAPALRPAGAGAGTLPNTGWVSEPQPQGDRYAA